MVSFLVFICFVVTALGDPFYPIYTVSGDHYSAFYDLGKLASERISAYLAEYPTLKSLKDYIETQTGLSQFNQLISYNENIFPDYFTELKGLSDGCNACNYTDILLLSFKHELNQLSKNGIKPIDLECSDMLVYNPDTFVGIGHNEDGWNGTYNTGFFSNITLKVDNKPDLSWIAYHYPGSIVGHAFGVNSYGIASSMNAVYPTDVELQGRGCYFLTRMMLDAKNINELIAAYENGSNNIMSSYGASINLATKNNDNKYTVVNIEISTKNMSVLSLNEDMPYSYHFNNYLRLNVPSKNDTSSVHRLERTQYMIANNYDNSLTTMDEIRNILGDTTDNEYPIWRSSIAPDSSSTLSTVIFDVKSQNMYLYEHCNPKECTPITINIDM